MYYKFAKPIYDARGTAAAAAAAPITGRGADGVGKIKKRRCMGERWKRAFFIRLFHRTHETCSLAAKWTSRRALDKTGATVAVP